MATSTNIYNPSPAAATENKHKSLVVCTGASRGIGRATALAIADAVRESTYGNSPPSAMMLSAPLRMVLIARSSDSLDETARLVETISAGLVTACCHEMDLSDLDSLAKKLQHKILRPLSGEQYESCLLINNAGSLGPLGLASSLSGMSSMKELRNAIDLNVTAAMWISSQFTKTFLAPPAAPAAMSPVVRIVNISSLCAIDPFPTMSFYCAGKAGRDMFHTVLAKEQSPTLTQTDKEADDDTEKQKQRFKVLNYAPGPCDTQMTDHLANCAVLDDGLHKHFTTSKQENKLVKPEDTAKKLVQILGLDEFENGSHVDYYDI